MIPDVSDVHSPPGSRPERVVPVEPVEPIGAEPVELTVELVRTDAALRDVTFDEAFELRKQAHGRVGDLMAFWDSDGIELQIETDGGWRPASEFAASSRTTWALLTAMNPMGQELPEEVNTERNRLMAAELRSPLRSPLRSLGRSVDGSWEEAGFAVAFDRTAVDVAQRFAQAAVYRVTPTGVQTVFLVGADPASLDRLIIEPADGTA